MYIVQTALIDELAAAALGPQVESLQRQSGRWRMLQFINCSILHLPDCLVLSALRLQAAADKQLRST